jgi:hypothetical protein
MSARDLACAALLVQPFAIYLTILRLVAPPTDANWSLADPFLRVLPASILPALGALVAAAWLRLARPSRAELRAGATRAAAGAAIGACLVLALRALAGPTLPPFIPPEESAGPGRFLSLAAGYGEELEFRLLLLPILYQLLAWRMRPRVAIALGVVVCAAAFTLAHAAAPTSWMLTRFLVPGGLFAAACFLVGPSFVVSAHCAAHVLLPILFAPS